ncbi:MAG: glycosyltransferase [Bacteroidaceae bacterium]|nr:glycosyltransferase [Bacteroidaceae bacterium]
MLRFTIATVCYNAGSSLRPTLRSVEQQDYPAIEHLIVDGASKDETLAQLHHYRERHQRDDALNVVFRSEPDKGIYDAMNKALRLATGDYILFLNAGDRLHTPHTISRIAEQLQSYAPDALPAVVYGDTDIVDANGHFVRRRRLTPPRRLSWRSFRQGMLVCHQAFYARLDLAQATPYDMNYRLSADFDWCIRLMQLAESRNLPLHNTGLTTADYLAEGATTANHKASLRERYHIMCHHYGLASTLLHHAWFVVRAIFRR